MTLRVIFMGTPDFAVPTLSEIVGAGHDVVAVYSQPPRRAGRGLEERKSPVHRAAEGLSIPVLTPLSLKDPDAQAAFSGHSADVAVVVAYGLILPKPVLFAPREGCLNLHASLLPRWRGAAPINRAIMAGDSETAVAIMRMEEGLDTGPVCLEERVPIGGDMTAGDLHDELARLGAGLVGRALAALSRGSLTCRPQATSGITYASKIDKAETRIDWDRPARIVHDHIRGLSPYPGAWFELGGQRIRVLRSRLEDARGAPGTLLDAGPTIACGEGAVRLLQVQRAGKGAMAGEDFLRGARLQAGAILS